MVYKAIFLMRYNNSQQIGIFVQLNKYIYIYIYIYNLHNNRFPVGKSLSLLGKDVNDSEESLSNSLKPQMEDLKNEIIRI